MTFAEGENDQAVVSDREGLASSAKLLGVTKEDLSKALCYRVVAARGEAIEKGHSIKDALYGKDGLCKVNDLRVEIWFLWLQVRRSLDLLGQKWVKIPPNGSIRLGQR